MSEIFNVSKFMQRDLLCNITSCFFVFSTLKKEENSEAGELLTV